MPSARFFKNPPNNCINLLYSIFCPYFCLRCFRFDPTGYLCQECLDQTNFGLGIYCLRCNRRRPATENFLQTCCETSLKSLIAFADYEDHLIVKLIQLGKFQGYFETIKFAGRLMTQELIKLKPILNDFTLVPIPASKQTWSRRRFNQSQVLARVISDQLGCPLLNSLAKTKETKPQRTLPAQERSANIKGALSVIAPPPPKVLLVDDIKTTGATLLEAAKVLRQAGAKTILGVTIVK